MKRWAAAGFVVALAAACGGKSDRDAEGEPETEPELGTECRTNSDCAGVALKSNPYVVAVCDRGTCGTLDLSQEPITECETGSECTLRANECCAADLATFIAVSAKKLAELDMILCDGHPPPMNCRVEPPMHQGAVCREQRCSSAFFDP